jgi:nucleoside-diphosphate-sugar epimerase
VHISTDEVYGEVGPNETHATESERLLAPTNPYAATKAAAEYLVLAYAKSFGLPVIITRGNNVYGPHQFPEKLIPKFSILLSRNQRLPLHGDGSNLRNFVYVSDVARALMGVMHRGVTGEIYNIGTDFELTNRQVAEELCRHFQSRPGQVHPEGRGSPVQRPPLRDRLEQDSSARLAAARVLEGRSDAHSRMVCARAGRVEALAALGDRPGVGAAPAHGTDMRQLTACDKRRQSEYEHLNYLKF